MDARQHQFPISFPRECLRFSQDVLRVPGPDPPPQIRNDAVGAELVAAVLDLQESPGVAVHGIRGKIFITEGFFHISCQQHLVFSRFFLLPEPLLKDLRDFCFLPVSQDDVHALVLFQLFRCRLGIASCCHDHRVRIHRPRPVQHLP